MHADPDFEAAIRCQTGGCLLMAGDHGNSPSRIDRGAMRGLFAIDRKADADQPAVALAGTLAFSHAGDIDRRKRATHRLRVVTAIDMLVGDVVERHIGWIDQVWQPHLPRLDT